tara:strand:+ start:71 stop:730 length:660 start_codon:yes stop_codon:yes gene_type:complete
MEIKSLKIYSYNFKEQLDFYKEVLGFDIEVHTESFKLLSQENELIVEKSDDLFYYHFAFLIPTGSLRAAIKFLESKDIELLLHHGSKIINFKTGEAIYFYDKDGNIVEFIERPDLDYLHKSTFSIKDIIKLNEIGLPVDNPKEVANILTTNYGIKPINTKGFTSKFCWVGDFNGVIIVTKKGRNWLPTDKPGIINDFSIKYEENGTLYNFTINRNFITS